MMQDFNVPNNYFLPDELRLLEVNILTMLTDYWGDTINDSIVSDLKFRILNPSYSGYGWSQQIPHAQKIPGSKEQAGYPRSAARRRCSIPPACTLYLLSLSPSDFFPPAYRCM